MISLTLPIRTVSEANTREHWAKRAKRAQSHRQHAHTVTRVWLLGSVPKTLPAIVTLTRLAPRTLDDDNLRGALKAVRDGVADALGVDDRDPRVSWEYAQEKHKVPGVRIEIRRRVP